MVTFFFATMLSRNNIWHSIFHVSPMYSLSELLIDTVYVSLCIHVFLCLTHTVGYYPSPFYSHAVDVVWLGVGEAIQALPPLAFCAPSLCGWPHGLKHYRCLVLCEIHDMACRLASGTLRGQTRDTNTGCTRIMHPHGGAIGKHMAVGIQGKVPCKTTDLGSATNSELPSKMDSVAITTLKCFDCFFHISSAWGSGWGWG